MTLEAGDVHVWRFTTDRAPHEMNQLHALLSEEERHRAKSFRFERDRSRFIGRRGLLRTLLARYQRCDPAHIVFVRNAFGKPTIGNGDCGRLQFNASHSDGVGLVAVTLDRAVGVDIERHRRDVECLRLADRFFAADEADALRRAEEAHRHTMFFTLWSCKEAWVKARGLGLSFPLSRCRVHVGEGAVRLLDDPEQPEEHRRWSLTQLLAGPEFSAALVVENHRDTMRLKIADWL